jgi:hypothetical protein
MTAIFLRNKNQSKVHPEMIANFSVENFFAFKVAANIAVYLSTMERNLVPFAFTTEIHIKMMKL